MKIILSTALICCCVLGRSQNIKQDSLAAFYDMSLDELNKIKASGVSSELEKMINSLIGVASQKALSTRESPSIVSLITQEEIKKSGARDLIDVLRLVPGFDVAFDGESGLGVGFRGNWVNEGKILLLMDGIEMNEIFSANLSLGNHYSVANISRIEIIRGPGSAIYGGFAEYGVINIVTKKGSELNGLSGQVSYGQMQKGFARRNLELGYGKKIKDWEFSLTGILGQGNRSDRSAFIPNSPAAGSQGGDYKSLQDAKSDPSQLIFKTKYKDLSIKAMYDNYQRSLLNGVNSVTGGFPTISNPSYYTEIKYDWKTSKRLTLTPRFSYISQTPKVTGLPDSIKINQVNGERLRSSLIASYDLNRKVNVIAGYEYFSDFTQNSSGSLNTLSGEVNSISYANHALFTQITAKTRLVNLFLGGRYDNNSKYGEAFVPRVGLTKKINQFNFKLLYSGSFRAPTIQNIARGVYSAKDYLESGKIESLKPEKTFITELEVGYQFSRNFLGTLNIFSSSTSNPIVYASGFNIYSNASKSGSKGFEVELKYRKNRNYFSFNYSYYTVQGESKVELYQTRDFSTPSSLYPDGAEKNSGSLLAFPNHKVTMNSSFYLTNKFLINPSLIVYGIRYGYNRIQTSPQVYGSELKAFDPSWLMNLSLQYEDVLIKKLSVGLTVNNLFDTAYSYLSPYYTSNGNIPSTSREYMLRLSYNIK